MSNLATLKPNSHLHPNPNAHRPKGCKNKFTTLKNMFLDVIKEAGGKEAVLDWIHKMKQGERVDEIDRKTFGLFLQMISKMLPNKVEAEVKYEPLVIFKPVIPKDNDKGKDTTSVPS